MTGEQPQTEMEFCLMVDFLGRSGVWGTERVFLGVVSEEHALERAREKLQHAGRVEIFTREVPVRWDKVEELLGG